MVRDTVTIQSILDQKSGGVGEMQELLLTYIQPKARMNKEHLSKNREYFFKWKKWGEVFPFQCHLEMIMDS